MALKKEAQGPADKPDPALQHLTVTQFHKVAIARGELAQRGFDVISVHGGGPWVLIYRSKA